jgi:hypothetical protein
MSQISQKVQDRVGRRVIGPFDQLYIARLDHHLLAAVGFWVPMRFER